MDVLNNTVYVRIDGENQHIFAGTEITKAFKKANSKVFAWMKAENFIDKFEGDESPQDDNTEQTTPVESATTVTVNNIPTDFADLKDFNDITVDEAELVAPTLSLDFAEEFMAIEEAREKPLRPRKGVMSALQKQIDVLTS